MESLDPDDFLADLADDPHHPHLPFPATEKLAEEEELEWLSNKDAFPALETCMLPEDPPGGVSGNAGSGVVLFPPLPIRKTKNESKKMMSMRVCTFCGVKQTLRQPGGRSGVCNVCGFSYKSGGHCSEDSPKVESIKSENVRKVKSDKVRRVYSDEVAIVESDKVKRVESNVVKRVESDEVKRIEVKRVESNEVKRFEGKCTHCGITKTPQWRMGPLGHKTLCNACGVRYKKGQLCPEYRPVNSPTFSPELHSNVHRKVLQIRKQVYGADGAVVEPVEKCTNNATTIVRKKIKKDMFPTVATVEQPSRSVFANQQSPASVLENSTNSTTTLEPNQPPSKRLRWQQQLCNQPNNKHSQEDTAKVELQRNSTILMSSSMIVKLPYKAPSAVLGEQQLFNCQPTNKRRKKNTVKVNSEGNNTTPISSCLEPPHQAPTEFVEQHQLSYDQPNKMCNEKHTANVEMIMEPLDIRTTVLKSKKDTSPTVFIAEPQQSPVLVLENSRNSSATLMGSQSNQFLFYNQANNKPNEKDTAKNNTSAMSYYGTLKLPYQAPSNFLGQQQQLLFDKPYNNCNKKDTSIVGIEVKCQNCGAEKSLQQWEGPLGPITLCRSCGMAKHTVRRKRNTSLASNKKRKRLDIAKVEIAVKPRDKCTNSTTALMNSKKDSLLAVDSSNISEQPNVIVIAEQQSHTSVFENSTNSSMTLVSSSATVNLPNQAPSEFPGQQNQFLDKANNKPKEKDTATVELEGKSSTLMRLSGTLELPHQAPNKTLDQQQLLCEKANNKSNKKDTATVESEGNGNTLMSSCGITKPPHQAQSEFLGQQQLFCNQANNETNKENIAKVESEGKCQSCGPEQSLQWLRGSHACELAKFTAQQQRIIAVEVEKLPCPLPATGEFTQSTQTTPDLKESSLSQKPSDKANAEHQKPFSVLENSRNNSIALMSSCGIKIPRRARSKGCCRRSRIPGQQVGIGKNCMQCGKQTNTWQMGLLGPTSLCNACGNKYQSSWGRSSVAVDIAKKCETCGSEETTHCLLCPRPKTLCPACHHLSNNDPGKKASAIERECLHCGATKTPLWRSGPLGFKTLCNACGIRWYKFQELCRDHRSKAALLKELHSDF